VTNLRGTIAVGVCGLALFAAGAALANGNPGHGKNQTTTGSSTNQTTSTDTTTTSGKPQGRAYGFYCQSQSRQHVAGQKGTPFSQCVTAMAKLASGKTDSPRKACAAMSKKHVNGQKGTPYSQCVTAGAKLLKNNH
jgi:hypothetical protein